MDLWRCHVILWHGGNSRDQCCCKGNKTFQENYLPGECRVMAMGYWGNVGDECFFMFRGAMCWWTLFSDWCNFWIAVRCRWGNVRSFLDDTVPELASLVSVVVRCGTKCGGSQRARCGCTPSILAYSSPVPAQKISSLDFITVEIIDLFSVCGEAKIWAEEDLQREGSWDSPFLSV